MIETSGTMDETTMKHRLDFDAIPMILVIVVRLPIHTRWKKEKIVWGEVVIRR